MFKSNFKIILRNLWKNKTFSAINIAGLSIGLAACLLILQFVSFKLSYDQFHPKVSNIYRVVNDRYQKGKLIQHGTITYSAIGKAMQNDFPEVVNHTRVVPLGSLILTYDNKKLEEKDAIAADPAFLQMFNFPLLAGDKISALKEPNAVMLSERLAKKLFDFHGNDYQSLIGKTFIISRDSLPYKVSAIFENVPENSHLQFSLVLSYQTLINTYQWKEADYDFTDSDFWHYIELRAGTNYKLVDAKLDDFSKRHFQGNKISGSDEKFWLQPLGKAHLYSDFEYEIGKTGSATVVWGLLIIAIFIMIIAWVNYINLATARASERAKEVGIRKVSGANRLQLIRQFLGESLFLNLIALVIAMVLVLVFQSRFNDLIQYNLSLSHLFEKGMEGYAISIGLLLLLVCGVLVSGFYPAFVLSAFKPILVLTGKFSSSGKGILLRKGLVIGQFAITISLIIGSFIVYKQMKFVNERDLGMNISQIMIIRAPELTKWDSTFIGRAYAFMDELRRIPNVINAATSDRIPGAELARNFNVRRIEHPDDKFTFRRNAISESFIPLYGMKIIAGRNFVSTDYHPDPNLIHNFLINETAVSLLGYKSAEDAIGKKILMGKRTCDIVGVVGDFHQKSLRYALEPTILGPFFGTDNPISVKINPANLSATIAAIKKEYDQFLPGNLFDYFFLDERFNEQYKNDQLFGKVFGRFAIFAILVASLGLLGLSLFSTLQRTKEIGVRKVLGASVSSIVILLSKDFIRLVIIALVIASPLAWYIMHNWLQDFAYRIQINWWIFILAGIVAIFIAIATISFQAIRSARANPVRSLRTE
jgi:putative ABC transport system permease protein